MFTQDPYPPSKRDKGDIFGRYLPPMPQKYLHPTDTYREGNSLLLSRPRNPSQPEFVKVKIEEPIDIGFAKSSQCVIAQVENGHPLLQSKNVFLKIFDSQYLNRDDIQVTIGKLEICSWRTGLVDRPSPATGLLIPISAAPLSTTAAHPSMRSPPRVASVNRFDEREYPHWKHYYYPKGV
jgi:hypothetical protein